MFPINKRRPVQPALSPHAPLAVGAPIAAVEPAFAAPLGDIVQQPPPGGAPSVAGPARPALPLQAPEPRLSVTGRIRSLSGAFYRRVPFLGSALAWATSGNVWAQAAAAGIAFAGLDGVANDDAQVPGNRIGVRVGLHGQEAFDRPAEMAPADQVGAVHEALVSTDAAHERLIFIFERWEEDEEQREVEREDKLNRWRQDAVARQWGGVGQVADMMEFMGTQNGFGLPQPVVPYAQLTPLLVTKDEIFGSECGILYTRFEEIEQAVAVQTGNSVHIFEYVVLMEHWQSHGTNPSTTRMLPLQDIRRVVVQEE